MNRRHFLAGVASGGVLAATGFGVWGGRARAAEDDIPVDGLSPMTGAAQPVTQAERHARLEKARDLMDRHGQDALLIEPGASLIYFTGIHWWRSERVTAALILRDGGIHVVTPAFEKPSVAESLDVAADIHVWQEHEDPFALIGRLLAGAGVSTGVLGIEESTRYFIVDGLRREAPAMQQISAWPVVQGCRLFKTPAELALMHTANAVTLKAYGHVIPRIAPGMTGGTIKAALNRAQTALGGSAPWAMALVGRASAYPHGTNEDKPVAEGDVVLMDVGCQVHDYRSDISRTIVVGAPDEAQQAMWRTVRQAQQLVMETARPGLPAGDLDSAVRGFYEGLGYGPGYETPGLSHRTGHGIGLETHEGIHLVKNERRELAPGMCFSNEPGLYDFDRFGVRIEDCWTMTADGPRWFTQPPESLSDPVGTLAPMPA
ncbi:M24 family metallopeptidase [Yunchengibacter salinarum]|uniref:M24 family metallopeptidase n=1 Tax=Yunchengibacter salinarum TaxID=3133399 RepID=UPI0035B58245